MKRGATFLVSRVLGATFLVSCVLGAGILLGNIAGQRVRIRIGEAWCMRTTWAALVIAAFVAFLGDLLTDPWVTLDQEAEGTTLRAAALPS